MREFGTFQMHEAKMNERPGPQKNGRKRGRVVGDHGKAAPQPADIAGENPNTPETQPGRNPNGAPESNAENSKQESEHHSGKDRRSGPKR